MIDVISTKMEKEYSYSEIEKIADFLKDRMSIEPRVGILCGTGLGYLEEILTDSTTILDYKSIPNFPTTTVVGHSGRLVFGAIDTTPVICFQGRFHFYEGYFLSTCTMPICLMKLLGVSVVIISNAAGSVNPSYKTGDIMLIKDHINFLGFSGNNPLRSPNDDKLGSRFLPLNDAYDEKMREEAKAVVKNLGLKGVYEGVYACVGGPNYETLAEVRMLQILGADAVGMSTIPEVIVARHCGIRCFAFSLITNEVVGDIENGEEPDSNKILAVGERKKEELKVFIRTIIQRIITFDQ